MWPTALCHTRANITWIWHVITVQRPRFSIEGKLQHRFDEPLTLERGQSETSWVDLVLLDVGVGDLRKTRRMNGAIVCPFHDISCLDDRFHKHPSTSARKMKVSRFFNRLSHIPLGTRRMGAHRPITHESIFILPVVFQTL